MKFERPSGILADVNELVYVATLHQTVETVRTDLTINEKDIELFLMSRYGIMVTSDDVRENILSGLTAGGASINDELDASKIDLMELTAILLIPTLIKATKNEFEKLELPGGVQIPPSNLISDVFRTLIQDVTGEYDDTVPHTLNVKLLQKMFVTYGEYELANNEQLLLDMIDCCNKQVKINESESKRTTTMNNTGEIRFNAETFAQGLTHDVGLYDIRGEVRSTTNKDDVFANLGYISSNNDRISNSARNVLYSPTEIRERNTLAKHVPTVFTFPAIDNTAGTYRSRSLMIFLWACTLITYFAYIFDLSKGRQTCQSFEYDINVPWVANADAILCECFFSILNWLFMFVSFCIFGLFSVGLVSIGNEIECEEWRFPAIGGTLVFLMTVTPFIATRDASASLEIQYLKYTSLILGLIVCSYHIGHIASLTLPKKWFDYFPTMRKLLNPVNIRSEGNHKRATAFKLNNLAENALKILKSDTDKDTILFSNFGRALYAFTKQQKRIEVGGFRWTWRRIIDNSIFREEGIWYSVRLRASNICQAIVTLFILAGGSTLTKYVIEEYDKEMAKEAAERVFLEIFLNATAPEEQFSEQQLTMLENAGFTLDLIRNTSQAILRQAVDDSVEQLYPSSEYMISVSMAIGVIIAFSVAVSVSVNLIPSITSTILKLRSGVIPLHGNPKLQQYRVAPESVALLTGGLFWGAFYSSVLIGGVFAAIIFFFVWQVTAYLAQRFLALAIGVLVISLIRLVVLTKCRANFYEGFYRKQPGAANLSILALEWANFALSSGFILVRMFKILLGAMFAVGRIDRPFFADGQGQIGPIELDAFPTIMIRDILATEAHRHPYIELLGTMYLMKLRYEDNFGKATGSCWRLLFVYALMPWLHRYRVSARPNEMQTSTAAISFIQPFNDGNNKETSVNGSLWDKNDSEHNKTYSMIAIEEAKVHALSLINDNTAVSSRRSILSDSGLNAAPDFTQDVKTRYFSAPQLHRLNSGKLIKIDPPSRLEGTDDGI